MDDLIDKVVMVHPNLTHDPADKRGQTGKITSIIGENDDVFVRFADNTISVYTLNSLLLLQPAPLIQENLRAGILGADNLEREDVAGILDVYLLHAAGQTKEALELAISNETLRIATVVFVDDWIDRGYGDDTGRDQGPALGR